ncbi:thiamine phosphate synthase [Salibacterium aidingense]|uniref:thiamine phosphate synthase n=1 Tax=Salibacterium aidingense TaxID=384933 RepID=UPI003BDF4627
MLHAISTGNQSFEQWLEVTKQIHQEADFVHIREKTWSARQLERAVEELLAAAVPPSKIIVNKRPELVRSWNLAGVHFPESNTLVFSNEAPFIKGSSVHSKTMAVQKENEGADYLFFGHIFDTPSKPGLPGRGLKQLQEITDAVSIPVLAIGGITPERVRLCLDYGAAGAAVMSGIYDAPDPAKAVQSFRSALLKGGMT